MAKGFYPAKKGAALHMADGGMFDGVKRALGFGPAETVTQKFARQDAERAAKNPQPVPAPSTPPAPAPAGFNANILKDSLARREKEAGLKNGGDLQTGQGGHVPGTGKGDKIPAKYEPGEFVVSNAMLAANPGMREQLHAVREQVLASQGKTPEQADAKNAAVMEKFGTPAADSQAKGFKPELFFASGGDELKKNSFGDAVAATVNPAVAQIPTSGPKAPAADGTQGNPLNNDLGRNVTNTLSALPGAAPALGAVGALAGATRAAPATAGAIGGMARMAAPVAPYAPVVAGGIALANAATPNTPEQVAPAAVPPTTPVTAPKAATPVATAPAPSATESANNPNQVKVSRQPNGVMEFSGDNISGPVSYTGPAGFKPSGAGVTVIPGGNVGSASPSSNAALAAARSAAADRGDFGAVRDSYFAQGQGFGGATKESVASDQLKQLALSAPGTPGRRAAQQMYSQELTNTTTRRTQEAADKLAQQRFGLDSEKAATEKTAAGFASRASKRIEDLQVAYEKAPAEGKAAIAEQLRVLSGKEKPATYKVAAGGQQTDEKGVVSKVPDQIYNEQTGQIMQQGAGPTGAKTPHGQDIARLKANPKDVALFEQVYGKGSAKQYLGK